MSRADRHRVVVGGGGFGGLFALRVLRHGLVEVTVVDRTNHHLFQPLLYQVETGILSSGEIAPPIRDIVRRQPRTSVVLGEVSGIHLSARTLTVHQVEAFHPIPYDRLIVATGSVPSYFDHDELSRWAPGMKSIDDALELRGRIFGAFEMAEVERDDPRPGRLLDLRCGGSGPNRGGDGRPDRRAGQALAPAELPPHRPRSAKVLLFDGGSNVLAEFGPRLAAKTKRDLGRLGIEVHLAFLTGFKNQITALFHWTISFLGRGRAERTITEQQVVARLAIEASQPQPP